MKIKIVKLLNCYIAKTRGFTLVELLIAMAIISILATGLIVIINPITQIQKANDARRKGDLAQIQKALETYYQDNRKYPASSVDYEIIAGDSAIEWGDTWMPYMGNLPEDLNPSLKKYVYYSDGQTYYLYASLDRGANDPQACSGAVCASLASNGISPEKCAVSGSAVCNYGISSPNVSP
ncbi:MAG: type II secretion system protein [Candidatus Levybacteria bacterium]|nr:type II secretion system protein [Candidatus Levybacteria bacterium]